MNERSFRLAVVILLAPVVVVLGVIAWCLYDLASVGNITFQTKTT